MNTDDTAIWEEFNETLAKAKELHFWWRDDDVQASKVGCSLSKLNSNLKYCSRLEKTLSLLQEYNIPAIYAVIPYNFLKYGKKQIKLLKKYHAFIALHGIMHKKNAADTANEFPDTCDNEKALQIICDYKIQFEKVFGNALLTSFVPPFNTINPTLEQMLLANGFSKVSKLNTPGENKPYHVDIDFMNWEIVKMKSPHDILTEIINRINQGQTVIGFNNHYRCINRENRTLFRQLFSTIAQHNNVNWIMPL